MSDDERYPYEVPLPAPGADDPEGLLELFLERLLGASSWMRRVKQGSWEEAAVKYAKAVLLERHPELLDQVAVARAKIDVADDERRERLRQAEVDYAERTTAATEELSPAADLFVRMP
jgi:hypothetical protein